MNVEELLTAVAARHGSLHAESGRIVYRLPDSPDAAQLLQGLRDNKAELLNLFSELPSDSEMIAPLSYFQSGIWFQCAMVPEMRSYNVATCFRVDTPLLQERFSSALASVGERYEILRTTFHDIPRRSLLLQCVRKPSAPSVSRFDAGPANDPSTGRFIQEIIDQPFDLKNGPVWRCAVVRCDGGQTIVVLVIHHIACDAITVKMIYRALECTYREDGESLARFREKSNTWFVDYVIHSLRLTQGERGRQLGAWWKDTLQGVPVSSSFPADFERPAIKKFDGTTVTMKIAGKMYQDIIKFCAVNSLPVVTVFLYCLFERLRDETGQEDLCIGMLTSGRTNPEFREVAGPLINTVPVRVLLPRSESVSANLTVVKTRMLEAMEMQDAPFGFILREINAPRVPDTTPLFQILFNMVPEELLGGLAPFVYAIETSRDLFFAGVPCSQVSFRHQEGQFDISVEVVAWDESYTFVLKYDDNLYTEQTIRRLLEEYMARLSVVVNSAVGGTRSQPQKTSDVKPAWELAISADFTIENSIPYIAFLANKANIPFTVRLLPAYQTQSNLRNPASDLFKIQRGAALLFIRPRDIIRSFERGVLDPSAFSRDLAEFREAIEACIKLAKVPLIIVHCPDRDPENAPPGWVRDAEEKIQRMLNDIKGCCIVSGRKLIDDYTVETWYDAVADAAGSVPYTEPMYAALAAGSIRAASAMVTRPFKAIAIDCDGTLWEGVAAEDGPEGIQILSHHIYLQKLLKRARSRGMLLCLCSKNEEPDVWAIFEKNARMVLAREDIDFWRINWNEKAENIREMAAQINIAPDAMIFIDDNPVECTRASMLLPDVCTVQLPRSGGEWESFFKHLWCFDDRKATEEDRLRAESYRANHQRESLRRLSGSFAEFLERLELHIAIEQARDELVPRISQLTWRTNQFNNAGIRRSESEIASIIGAEGCVVRAVNVEDRFGRYGYTGVMIGRREADTLVVDTFLLSCRVLGRGVEYAMCANLACEALRLGCSKLAIASTPTEKNTPFRLFIEDITKGNGFLHHQNDAFVFDAALLQKCSFNPNQHIELPRDAPKSDTASVGGHYCSISAKSYMDIAEVTAKADTIIQACRRKRSGTAGGVHHAGRQAPVPAVNDDIERVLFEIWKGLFPPDTQFTKHDTFFECGGTSIMIPRICSALQGQLGISVSIVDILQSPSIVLLAQQIRNRNQANKPQTGMIDKTDRGKAVYEGTSNYAERVKRVRASFLNGK